MLIDPRNRSSIQVATDVHRQAKIHAAKTGKTVREITEKALTAAIKQEKKK